MVCTLTGRGGVKDCERERERSGGCCGLQGNETDRDIKGESETFASIMAPSGSSCSLQ